jgi:hypothetical protein
MRKKKLRSLQDDQRDDAPTVEPERGPGSHIFSLRLSSCRSIVRANAVPRAGIVLISSMMYTSCLVVHATVYPALSGYILSQAGHPTETNRMEFCERGLECVWMLGVCRCMADSTSRLYVVFNQRDTNAEGTQVLLLTEDPEEAITYAQQYQGVVYEYEATEHADYLNEKLFYDGTNPGE